MGSAALLGRRDDRQGQAGRLARFRRPDTVEAAREKLPDHRRDAFPAFPSHHRPPVDAEYIGELLLRQVQGIDPQRSEFLPGHKPMRQIVTFCTSK